MAEIGGSIVWNLDVNDSKFKSGLNSASSTAKNASKDIEKNISDSANNSADTFASAMSRIAKVAAVGFAAAGAAATGMFVSAVKATASLEQSLGGSVVVFGEFSKEIQELARNSAPMMGTSMNQFLETANKMGSLFQGAGFDVQTSMKMSTSAMQRATDVATAMGVSTEMALESIAGAAKGNFTMMDNLGVAMNENTLNAFALTKGINKTVTSMTNQEKIGLAMQLFMEKTAKFTGNYARENDTLAGSFQTLKGAWGNMMSGVEGSEEQFKQALGNMVNVLGERLPQIFAKLRESVRNLVTSFLDANPQIRTFLAVFQQVATVIGILLIPALLRYIALQTLAGVNALIAGARMMAGWLMALGPIGLITAAVGAVAYLIIANWETVRGWLSSFWNWVVRAAQIAWGGVVSAFSGVTNFFRNIWNSVTGWFVNIGHTVGNAIGSAFKTVVNSALGFLESRINDIVSVMNNAIHQIDNITPGTLGRINGVRIPRLAEGGIVPATSGGRLAIVGEGGEDEAVIPLSKLETMNNQGPSIVNNIGTINISKEVDGEKWLQKLSRQSQVAGLGLVGPTNV